MTFVVRLLPQALNDRARVFRFGLRYREEVPAALRRLEECDAMILSLATRPERFPRSRRYLAGCRWLVCHGYKVFFAVDTKRSTVTVLRIRGIHEDCPTR